MELFRQITANNLMLVNCPFERELSMEAYLLDNQEILKLDDKNFLEPVILDAEIALKKGRKNGDGRIDILAKYNNEYLAIVELKIGEINDDTLNQLEDYLKVRTQLLNFPESDYWDETAEPKWIGILVGSSISRDLQDKIESGYKSFGDIPVAAMIIKRFRANTSDIFVTTDTFFKYPYTNKNYSTFTFNGKQYNKGRLVNAVIKEFVGKSPGITYADLEKTFPKHAVQPQYGCFILSKDAENIFSSTGHKRYYIAQNEVISLAGGVTISTCNQWDLKRITMFIDHVNNNIKGFSIT